VTAARTLVTGGAGYVGSMAVAALLDAGHRVRVLDSLAVGDGSSMLQLREHDGFEFVAGDVRDAHARRSALEDVDAVVHLAAIVGDPACARDPDTARAVNVDATRGFLEECEARGVARFVFASTCSNYGKLVDGDAFATEDWQLRPVSLYAETKVASELEVLAASRDGFATTCLRFATVYGVSPRMRFDLTVNEFARDALLAGELVVYGEEFWRPYIHVHDAARAVAAVLATPVEQVAGEVFNVGSTGENFRKKDLVEMLLERLPGTTVQRVAQAEDPRDYRVSFDKIRDRLGFSIGTSVDQGIDEVLELLRSGAVDDPYSDVVRN
jgi:nucleoside-diphosphate-sugar epimerase